MIDVFYDDIYQAYRLKARTWSGFHGEMGIPLPDPLPDVTITKDMEIHVYTTLGLNSSGVATCWNGGYRT